MITKDQITNAIPEALRPFLIITVTSEIHDDSGITIEAFLVALQHFHCAVQNWRQVFVHFGESPFTSESNVGRAELTLSDLPVALCWQDGIYFDVKRLNGHLFDQRVAAFLEELCHVFLNIKNEPLVKRVVAHLYPRLSYENGNYHIERNPKYDV